MIQEGWLRGLDTTYTEQAPNLEGDSFVPVARPSGGCIDPSPLSLPFGRDANYRADEKSA
jgi:hypothetical protein